MNKLMVAVGAVVLAGVVVGCATGKVGEDKVAAWQKDRTPVEVLKSKIEVKAAGAVVEALDVAPFGIYKLLQTRSTRLLSWIAIARYIWAMSVTFRR